MRKRGTIMCAMVLAGVTFGSTGAARAQTFAPIQCASPLSVGFRYHSLEEALHSTMYLYQNHIDQLHYFVANRYVNAANLNLTSFDMEWNWDYLRVGDYNGTTYNTAIALTGNYNGSTPFLLSAMAPPTSADSLQRYPGYIEMLTDVSNQSPGFQLDGVTVTCGGYNALETQLIPFERYSGVLLGTNDTVYMSIPSTADHQTVAMWSEAGDVGFDPDIWVRCGAIPTTPSGYTQRDYRAGGNGFIHMASGECPVGSTWHIAVNSYSGKGQFDIIWSRHMDSTHGLIHAGVDSWVTATQLEQYKSELTTAARLWYWWSRGTQYLADIYVHTVAGGYPSLCQCGSGGFSTCTTMLYNAPARAHSGICEGCTQLYTSGSGGFPGGFGVPKVYTHEWGHRYLCLDDEYDSGTLTPLCGHSSMAAYLDQDTYCYSGDHNTDGAGGSGQASVFSKIYADGKSLYQPVRTPDPCDNSRQTSFDFNNLVGTIHSVTY